MACLAILGDLCTFFKAKAIENFSPYQQRLYGIFDFRSSVDYHLFGRNYCCFHSGIRFTLYWSTSSW